MLCPKRLQKILLSIFVVMPMALSAMHIDRIVSFGDSLSDNGNTYGVTHFLKRWEQDAEIPLTPPYYQGRFTNGPVWVEQLAKHISGREDISGVLKDWSFGGSWAEDYADSQEAFPPSLGTQIFMYKKAGFDFWPKDHLFIVWTGANDYFGGRADVDAATTNVISKIKDAIVELHDLGARNFMIPNLPDLGKTPFGVAGGADFSQQQTDLSVAHNQKLAVMIADLRAQYPDSHFFDLDVFNDFNTLMQTHTLEGVYFSNVDTACYGGPLRGYTPYNPKFPQATAGTQLLKTKTGIDVHKNPMLRAAYRVGQLYFVGQKPCDDPDDYLFWDSVHPTKKVHDLLAKAAWEELQNA